MITIHNIIREINLPSNLLLLQNRGFTINVNGINMYQWTITINNNNNTRIFDLDITNGIIRPSNISTDTVWFNQFTRQSQSSSHGICINEIAHIGLIQSIRRFNISIMEFIINMIENLNDTTLIRGRRIGIRGG